MMFHYRIARRTNTYDVASAITDLSLFSCSVYKTVALDVSVEFMRKEIKCKTYQKQDKPLMAVGA
jgi:hypothetical protein